MMIDENDKDYQELRSCYEMVPHRDDPATRWMIRIIKGPYEGLVYSYGKFRLKENTEEDRLHCEYQYEILEVPDQLKEHPLDEDEKKVFESYIGMIVCQVLQDYWASEEKVLKFAKRVKELQDDSDGELPEILSKEQSDILDNFSTRIKVKDEADE
jgi:hypothetical protein